MYDDCTSLGRSTEPDRDKVLFFLNGKTGEHVDKDLTKVVSGLWNLNQYWVEDAHETTVTGTSGIEDCILKVIHLPCHPHFSVAFGLFICQVFAALSLCSIVQSPQAELDESEQTSC